MEKDRWDKADIIAKMVVGALVPVVVAFFGYKINRSIQEKALQQKDVELSQKYIEIAVGILNSDPSKKEKEPLRDWAINVLKKYSPIEISPAAIKALKEQRLSATVILSGVSAQAQAGQLKVTTTQGNTPGTTSTKGIEGVGTKAEPGQLTVTVD